MPFDVDINNGRMLGEALLISVFTPTWNRAHLLPRVYESLTAQTVRNFEWVVFDDGSTDTTESLVRSWFSIADFPVRYVKSCNRGKATAMNQGALLASGELFLVLDSDDAAAHNAMQRFGEVWNSLEVEDRTANYMGMSSLKIDFGGDLVGDDYRALVGKRLSYIDRKNFGVRGDKWEVLRTDLVRTCPYPLHPGERYMAPSYSWLVLARNYFTVFINEPLGIVEYQSDGISANNIKHRVGSSKSTYKYYREFAADRRFNCFVRALYSVNLNRFALHGGGALVFRPLLTVLVLPVAIVFFVKDLVALAKTSGGEL